MPLLHDAALAAMFDLAIAGDHAALRSMSSVVRDLEASGEHQDEDDLREADEAPGLPSPDVSTGGDRDAEAMARFYADTFNALELLGQDIEDLAHDADSELDGSGWNIARNRAGHWSAVRDHAELAESLGMWALMEAGGERAPKGGVTIAGTFFLGGRFIPAAAMAKASPEDKARLEAAKAGAAQKAEKKATARQERGSVDTGKLANRLRAHADAHPLSKDEKRWAASAARMLHRHHGAMTAHRIEELADRIDRALHEIDDDHPNSEGLRSYFGRQLAKLHQALGHAQDKGVTGEVVRPVAVEPEPVATGGGTPSPDVPVGGGASPATPSPYEAKRSHQGEPIVFPKPITGPSGTQLLSYDWKWEPFEEPDARGEEMVTRKVSDWTQAEKNLQTGKNVVHHFRIKTPDGQHHTVSLETALRMMGYTGGADTSKVRGLSSAVKTLAKLRMELSLKQQQKQAYDAAVATAKKQIDAMEVPAVVREPHPTNPDLSILKMGDVRVFDRSKDGPIPGERLQTLTDLWRGSRQHELIPADVRGMNEGGMLSGRIDDLTKRISRAEKSVADASAAASAGSPTSPDAPGFTGTDAQGRQWQDGKLVAKPEETGQPDTSSPDVSQGGEAVGQAGGQPAGEAGGEPGDDALPPLPSIIPLWPDEYAPTKPDAEKKKRPTSDYRQRAIAAVAAEEEKVRKLYDALKQHNFFAVAAGGLHPGDIGTHFRGRIEGLRRTGNPHPTPTVGDVDRHVTDAISDLRKRAARLVADASREGKKPVPPEVLADYPDLAASLPGQPPGDQATGQTADVSAGSGNGGASPVKPIYQRVRVSDIDHPSQSNLLSARAWKKNAHAQIQALRAKIAKEPIGGNRQGLRMQLVKMQSEHNDWMDAEKQALRDLEGQANRQGKTTLNLAPDFTGVDTFGRQWLNGQLEADLSTAKAPSQPIQPTAPTPPVATSGGGSTGGAGQQPPTTAQPPEPGFTGIDSLGRRWENGKLVAKPEETTADATGSAAEPTAGPGAGRPDVGGDDGGRPGGAPATAAKLPPSKERIVTARADLVKPADPGLVPEGLRQHLDEHQVQGAAHAIRALDAHGGFLLADGTGTGKTRQQLAIAARYAAQGKKVLIVTKAEVIKPDWGKGKVTGSFANDSATMGVPLSLNKGDQPIGNGQVHVTTYDRLAEIKGKVDKDTVLIFDESHSLKNWGSARSKHGYEMSKAAGAVMYATATPADKPLHIAHLFRAKVFGTGKWEETYRELGMRQVDVRTPQGTIQKWEIDPKVGYAESLRRMSGLFDRMIEDGLMLKREISMEGVDVGVDRIELPEEAHTKMAAIDKHIRATTENKGLAGALSLMQQRRQQEPYKIAHAVEAAKKELAEGRQVVIFASRVSESEVKGADDEVIVGSAGTAGLLRQAFADAGISDIAELHGGVTPRARQKAVDDFQSGKSRVIIATVESGGTGINLDDSQGKSPRSLIMLTPPFSAVENVQAAGRVHRLKTQSASRIRYVFGNTAVDDWNAGLIASKMKTLGAVVGGEVGKLDVSSLGVSAEGEEELADEKVKAKPDRYQWRPLVRQAAPAPTPAVQPAATPAAQPTATTPPAKRAISIRRVSTSRGERSVHAFAPNESFWSARKSGKVPDNVTVRKNDRTGQWEASIWGANDDEIHATRERLKKAGVRLPESRQRIALSDHDSDRLVLLAEARHLEDAGAFAHASRKRTELLERFGPTPPA